MFVHRAEIRQMIVVEKELTKNGRRLPYRSQNYPDITAPNKKPI